MNIDSATSAGESKKISVTRASVKDFLTLETITSAPTPSRNISLKDRNEIKAFLRAYKQFLKSTVIRSSLEPIYNRLFEWLQQQGGGGSAGDGSSSGSGSSDCDEELVWGFGNACMIQQDSGMNHYVIMEVMVEVELSKDGALLIRPREHTGVSLNREVVTAITNTDNPKANADSNNSSKSEALLSSLYRSVSHMDTSQLSPGEPSSYIKILNEWQ